MFNSWFRKERPILGSTGFGGGATSLFRGGAEDLNSGITATGGTSNTATDPDGVSWTSHKFTSSGTFSVSAVEGTGLVEYLVVAGGGGGSGGTPWDGAGGAGGAGGFRTNIDGHPLAGGEFPVSASPGSYTVTIGAGGGGSAHGPIPPHDPPHGASPGTDGEPSVFGTITSTGGGGGGGAGWNPEGGVGRPGGSGGGGGASGPPSADDSGEGNDPATTPPQGNDGGYQKGARGGGGGGGAGQAGAPSSNNPNWPNNQGGTGGEGSPVPDYFLGGPTVSPGYGTPGPSPGRYFAGGAGGGTNLNPPTLIGGEGGNGGGGDGGNTTNTPGSAGTTNTGGGGGGGGNGPPPAPDPGAPGASGGPGFVCVRYRNN